VGQTSDRASPDRKGIQRGSAFLWLGVALVWTVWVLAVGTEKNPPNNWLTKMFSDKMLHAGSFTVGGLLWIHSMRQLIRRGITFSVVGGGIIPLAFGVILELLQRRVPGRTADPNDLAADLGGILAAVALYLLAALVFTRRHAPERHAREQAGP
jgi:VanZ family protein